MMLSIWTAYLSFVVSIFVTEEESLLHEQRLHRVDGDWGCKVLYKHPKTVEESTNVTKPVKNAIGLSFYLSLAL